jgi:hypothetical protein
MDSRKLPIVGKKYICFDDGKVTLSRAYVVKILDIFMIEDAPIEVLNRWREEFEDDSNFYLKDNKYLFYAESYETAQHPTISIFVQNIKNDWFSFGLENTFHMWNCGILDVDGKLSKSLSAEDLYVLNQMLK